MSGTALPQVRLPSVGFVSQAEYDAWCDHAAPLIEAQARTDHAMFAAGDPHETLRHAVTCAACLRPATLTVATKAGAARYTQECDCEDALSLPARALLHAAGAEGGLLPWSRLLLFGPAVAVHRRMARLGQDSAHLAGFGADGRLDAVDGHFHLILSAGSLPQIAALDRGVAELRRVLAPGGVMLAGLPFRPRARNTIAQPLRPEAIQGGMSARDAHDIGWDVLALLRSAGFAQAIVLRVWSHELGYWGPSNFILKAVA